MRQTAREWVANDVDPLSRSELQRLIREADSGSATAERELTERMSGMPRFGTAGLRAPVRAGANAMNRAVVIRTTFGVASWLLRNDGSGLVLIGRDARHGSEEFATTAAAVLAAAGFAVRVLSEPLPTPVLAHATRAHSAVAGIQITASHNPPEDNGYKLYLHGGVQLVSPTDTEIEAEISATPPAREVPLADTWQWYDSGLVDYLDRVLELPRSPHRRLRIAATALHGVGAEPLRQALLRAGFDDVRFVASQVEPDPDFPTVGFPNPEEPGATDALLELAERVDADLAIALDPDGDRCALGVREPTGWRMLRGDETGVLLAEHVLSTIDEPAARSALVATTLVSATMLRAIAADFDVRYAETLTGFKWLVRAGDGRGTGLVYAYEEALGHCVDPDHVRDKDGISAALFGCDLAASLAARGSDLPGLLEQLQLRYGVHETGQVSVRVSDLGMIDETMRRLRQRPPETLGATRVDTRDLLPDTDGLVLTGDGGLRVVIRPSGTEPKLKCYLQVVEHPADTANQPASRANVADPATPDTPLTVAKRRAAHRLAELRAAVTGLVSPEHSDSDQ